MAIHIYLEVCMYTKNIHMCICIFVIVYHCNDTKKPSEFPFPPFSLNITFLSHFLLTHQNDVNSYGEAITKKETSMSCEVNK